MGGKNEDTIEVGKKAKPKKAKDDAPGGVLDPNTSQQAIPAVRQVPELSQKIRFHLNQGMIHFHLDDDKLKVEVPVAVWWSAWQELKNLRQNEWRYVDHERGTMLEVTAGLSQDGKFDICPVVTKVAQGSGAIFSQLDEFTTKCRSGKK
jgi:hypothetical protein